ncbi:MAG: hypothetical protein ABI759_04025 [Candidatus Solibacter sp.]
MQHPKGGAILRALSAWLASCLSVLGGGASSTRAWMRVPGAAAAMQSRCVMLSQTRTLVGPGMPAR